MQICFFKSYVDTVTIVYFSPEAFDILFFLSRENYKKHKANVFMFRHIFLYCNLNSNKRHFEEQLKNDKENVIYVVRNLCIQNIFLLLEIKLI